MASGWCTAGRWPGRCRSCPAGWPGPPSRTSRARPAPDGRCALIIDELRQLLAEVTRRPDLLAAPADAPLFGTGIGLDSLAGTLLLREIRRRYGVDVAAEDINLDALASLATLAGFIQGRRPPA
jgi:acyl carrier protein